MNNTEHFKTPIYQRNAYKNYLARKNGDEDFIKHRKEQQREYYRKNREKILLRMKEKKQEALAKKLETLEHD